MAKYQYTPQTPPTAVYVDAEQLTIPMQLFDAQTGTYSGDPGDFLVTNADGSQVIITNTDFTTNYTYISG